MKELTVYIPSVGEDVKVLGLHTVKRNIKLWKHFGKVFGSFLKFNR